MPPTIALLLTILFIAFLYARDYKERCTPSLALLIPCLWVLIHGSRSVSEWANVLLGVNVAGGDVAEGSPLDRNVTFVLMAAGLAVLLKRGISWSNVFRSNPWLILFFFYCALSILWSDFPLLALKRWFKALADPIMVLIILTDRDPLKALDIVLRTMVYFLVPFSVLFVKYYPHLGRTYSEWTGAASYGGVTTNKNALGFVLMLCGLALVWRLYRTGSVKSWNKIDNVGMPLVLLLMVGWLFQIADSMTSFVCFLIGVTLFVVLGYSTIRKHLSVYLIIGVLVFLVLQATVNITDLLLSGTGRDGTLTGRTALWAVLLPMQQQPVFGYGFESFWLGDRLTKLQSLWYWKPTQAHSGYIELYLNLGWIGWLFFGAVILSCYWKMTKLLTMGRWMDDRLLLGRLGVTYLLVYLLYNYTEAGFKSLHLLFLFFLLFTMVDVSRGGLVKSVSAALPGRARNISATVVDPLPTV